MGKKVYFAGSIKGGRADADLYVRIIDYIKSKGHRVLTEHVGNLSLSKLEEGPNHEEAIYRQDTGWLREADIVVAECTTPSLGVGYEMAYAEAHAKPVWIFYNAGRTVLSAMLSGDEYFHIVPYNKEEEIYAKIDQIL